MDDILGGAILVVIVEYTMNEIILFFFISRNVKAQVDVE